MSRVPLSAVAIPAEFPVPPSSPSLVSRTVTTIVVAIALAVAVAIAIAIPIAIPTATDKTNS